MAAAQTGTARRAGLGGPAALTDAGFHDIRSRAMGDSDDEHLRAVETHGKSIADDRVAAFETMVLEATCPCES